MFDKEIRNGIMMNKIYNILKYYYLPIIAVVFIIVLWEFIVKLFHIPPYILPSVSNILEEFAGNFLTIWQHTVYTAKEILVGYMISIVIAVPLSIIIAFSGFLRKTLYPMAVTFEMIPKIAFAPIFIVWIGFGFTSKILVVFLVCFFPILINSIFGFVSLSNELTYFARSTGARGIKTFWKIRLPAAAPQIFIGLKGAAINATVGATIAEWVGSSSGLGYYIQVAIGIFKMDLALASIAMLTFLGLLLYGIVLLFEKQILYWHISQRREN